MNCPPYALFITAKDVDIDYTNSVLQRAHDCNYTDTWDMWVATDKYSDAPKDDHKTSTSKGSEPPLKDLPSQWLAKSVEDCANWLKQAPSDIALNKNYFGILDDHSKEEDNVMLVRIVEEHDEREAGMIQYYPVASDQAALVLFTAVSSKFEEGLWIYKCTQGRQGKPDRSKGGPYSKDRGCE